MPEKVVEITTYPLSFNICSPAIKASIGIGVVTGAVALLSKDNFIQRELPLILSAVGVTFFGAIAMEVRDRLGGVSQKAYEDDRGFRKKVIDVLTFPFDKDVYTNASIASIGVGTVTLVVKVISNDSVLSLKDYIVTSPAFIAPLIVASSATIRTKLRARLQNDTEKKMRKEEKDSYPGFMFRISTLFDNCGDVLYSNDKQGTVLNYIRDHKGSKDIRFLSALGEAINSGGRSFKLRHEEREFFFLLGAERSDGSVTIYGNDIT